MILEASNLTLQEGAKPAMAEVLEPRGQNREKLQNDQMAAAHRGLRKIMATIKANIRS